jgi:hypothetical protein
MSKYVFRKKKVKHSTSQGLKEIKPKAEAQQATTTTNAGG